MERKRKEKERIKGIRKKTNATYLAADSCTRSASAPGAGNSGSRPSVRTGRIPEAAGHPAAPPAARWLDRCAAALRG